MRNTKSKKQNASLFKDKYEQKGITLIALVITIIVMLILVGVTISMAINGGLFGYAKKATKDTESQKQAEQELASGEVTVNGKDYASIDDYLNNKLKIPNYSDDLLDKTTGMLTKNAKYTSNEKTAIIPKGFAIVSDENGEKSIAKGLVITDKVDSTGKSIGNEYVWVPVENADGTLVRTEWSNNEPTGTINENYTETLPDDLVNSVKAYKGFYIGRYEAGSEEPRTGAGKDNLTDVLTQKGLYPYSYVSQENAANQTAKMYTDKTKYGVVATLPYGAMWDETLRFVKDDDHNVTNSTKWGNYYNTTFKFTGKYCENPSATEPTYTEETNKDKPENTEWLLTTGASERNKAKNIYDLAGNVFEWTQESKSTSYRVFRGGSYYSYGGGPASIRNGIGPSITSFNLGFRPALYIK